jgi:peptidoglycan/LPS O-acetylase OafA/YrhL
VSARAAIAKIVGTGPRRKTTSALFTFAIQAGRKKCQRDKIHVLSFSAHSSGREKTRNTQLDVLRCFAIIGVLIVHTVRFRKPTWDLVFVNTGWLGVDLFFVLSGFLISGLMFSEFQRRGTVSLKRFWTRRIFKIWPPLYALIFLTIPVRIAVNHFHGFRDALKRLLVDIFFLQSYTGCTWDHCWSLGVEEHFYILLPLAFWLTLRKTIAGDRDPFRWIPWAFIVIALVELCVRLVTAHFFHPWAYYVNVFPSHLRMDSLFAGVTISYFAHFRKQRFEEFARKYYWALAVAACVFLAVPYAPGMPEMWMLTYGYTCFYLSFGALLIVALHTPIEKAWWPVRSLMASLAYIGTFSYSIYLWHIAWLEMITFFGIVQLPIGLAAYYAGAVLVGIAASKLVEVPALRLRDKLFPARGYAVEGEAVNVPAPAIARLPLLQE